MDIEVSSELLTELLDRQRASDDTYLRIGNRKLLLLYILDDYTDVERAVAKAISLDIRGSYGYFLNRNNAFSSSTGDKVLEWSGNMFSIVVNFTKEKTYLQYLESDDEEELNRSFEMPLAEWEDALLKWKSAYLKELGFLEFNSEALSHFLGILIMSQNIMEHSWLYHSNIQTAIGQCVERYGVSWQRLYNDCRYVTGMYNLSEVFTWIENLLSGESPRKNDEFVMSHIEEIDDRFRVVAEEFLSIEF